MPVITLPYGKSEMRASLPEGLVVETIAPAAAPGAADPLGVVRAALEAPCGGVSLEDWRGAGTAAIAVNDKTRPAPHTYLLPPLLEGLERLGLAPERIQILIAAGAHPPMPPEEFGMVLPAEILAHYPVSCHDAKDPAQLVYLGETGRETPVWINRAFVEAELRIVVGNIEPHQFQGYSGGVKSAAIGLAGYQTISRNHAWMMDPQALLGEYDHNPARQDVEDIGQLAGVHFALNSVLNEHKEIVAALAGAPLAVMQAGIPLVERICQAPVQRPFDLTIAAPGGYPKDLNLYQAQKALAHASLVTRPGGAIILVAACPEGSGSQSYEAWMAGLDTYEAVFAKFKAEGFRVGPHKAFQIARDAAKGRTILVSEMAPEKVRGLLLEPAHTLQEALDRILPALPVGARVGVLPRANATIPKLLKGNHE